MPWQCEGCATEVPDDTPECPSCQSPKTSWTMVAAHTRTFVVSGKQIVPMRGQGGEPTAAGAETEDLVEAAEVYALTKSRARAIAAAGQRPPTRSVLTARLFPRTDRDWTVGLEVAFDTQEVEERSFPRDAAAGFDGKGHVDALRLLFVYGAEDGQPIAFDGLEVIDVSEETALGHAPRVGLTAWKKPPREVEVLAEPSFWLAARFFDATGHVAVGARTFTVEGREGTTDEHGVARLDGMPLRSLKVVFEDGEALAPPMLGPTMLCNVFLPFVTSSDEDRAPRVEERWSWELSPAPEEQPAQEAPTRLPDWFHWHEEDDAERERPEVRTTELEAGLHSWGVEPADEPTDAGQTGLLLAQLFDAEGESPLAGQGYTIRTASGEERYSGTLDDQGALRHEDVPADDYVIEVAGRQQTSVLLVLDPDHSPLIRYLA